MYNLISKKWSKELKKNFYVFGISAFIFIILALLVQNIGILAKAELVIINMVQALLKSIPLSVAKFISSLGHERYWLYALIIGTLFLLINKKFKAGILYLLAIYGADKLYHLIKGIITRPRPSVDVRLIDISGYSFPSGHSTMSMVTYGLLIYFVCRFVRNKFLKAVLIALLSLLIICVGISRIWLGVHFPTDVIGGFAFGICVISICAILYEVK